MNFTKKLILNILLILTYLILPHQIKAEVIGKIEAHVGNRIITSYDIESLDPVTYKKILNIPDETTRETQLSQYKEQALNFLIESTIMEIAAERDGIKVTDAEVDRAVNEIAANNKVSVEQFEKMITKEGVSFAQYRYQLRGQIIQARVRSQIFMPQVVITDEDMHNMINKKGDEYGLKDRYKTKIITAQTKSEIKKIIKEIKNGADFGDEARKNSLDVSAAEGGDLGWVDVTYVPIEMENALEKVKNGGMTEPFKYNDLWAVCYVDGFQSKYIMDNETAGKIKNAIGEELFAKSVAEWLKKHKETIIVLKASDRFKVK